MAARVARKQETKAPAQVWLVRAEWAVAAVLTLLIVALHVVNWRSAGALWRDEAAALALAQKPTFGAVWQHIEHESFPLLITLLLRGWTAVGLGEADSHLRLLGLLVGLAVLGAVWWNALQFTRTPPIVALVLFGCSSVAIRWGDSLRAYGLGALFLLVTLALVWRVVNAPSTRNIIFAMCAALLAVQALYQNAFLVGGICVAAAIVSGWRPLLIPVPAAVSLLPYLGVVRRANEWNLATQVQLDLERIWTVFSRALSAPTQLMLWLWAAAILLAVASVRRDTRSQFLALTIAGTTAASFLFLKLTRFPTEVWYYLVWMGITAVAVDALITRGTIARAVRLLVVIAAAAILFPAATQQLQVRMTNIDLVAQQLNTTSAAGDLVLVHPWFTGASFRRYYTGAAEWLTLPPIPQDGLQRLDLLKEQMRLDAPMQPVLEKMETVLKNGGSVWLVGHFPFTDPPQPPPLLPRAGEGPEGWRAAPYMMAYGMEAAYFLQLNATASETIDVAIEQPVNPFENLPLRRISGWRRPALFNPFDR
jgi:hypothetical protein